MILLALRHYYDIFESTTPDFVARIWIGDRFAGEHTYHGHTTERATVTVPTGQVVSAPGADVTLQNDGTGRLFYRIGLQTAPKSLDLTPVDRGFVVARSYQAVDDPRAILLYERYTDEDAFQAHRRTPHFREIVEQQVVPLLDERSWSRMQPLPLS